MPLLEKFVWNLYSYSPILKKEKNKLDIIQPPQRLHPGFFKYMF